jgi:hypothetical protein
MTKGKKKSNKRKYRGRRMRGGGGPEIRSAGDIAGTAPPSSTAASSTRTTPGGGKSRVQRASAKAKRFLLEWFNIEQWLRFSKLFFAIGFVIYIVSSASGSKDGMLVAYYWVTIGVGVMLFMSTIMVSMNKNASGFFATLQSALPLVIPTLFLLVPLVTLIYIFTATAPILARDAQLPAAYNRINTFVFFFIIAQIVCLNGFFHSEIKNLKSGQVDPNKWVYISALILATILTSAATAELYVIITSFLTDG